MVVALPPQIAREILERFTKLKEGLRFREPITSGKGSGGMLLLLHTGERVARRILLAHVAEPNALKN